MYWEEKALREIVAILIDKCVDADEAFEKLYSAGIEFNVELGNSTYGVPEEILEKMTNWDCVSENVKGYQYGRVERETLVDRILEYMKEKVAS